jgi:gamma-glutamylcyclotransferase (GGCT)/AIG2-like uncharacterized protein YtfP
MTGAKYLGIAQTERGYALGKVQGLPGMVRTGSRNEAVRGELYEVSEAHMGRLNDWEDQRYAQETVRMNDGRMALAYVLPYGPGELRTVRQEDWQ